MHTPADEQRSYSESAPTRSPFLFSIFQAYLRFFRMDSPIDGKTPSAKNLGVDYVVNFNFANAKGRGATDPLGIARFFVADADTIQIRMKPQYSSKN